MDLEEAWMDSYEKYKCAKVDGNKEAMEEHYIGLTRIETELYALAFEAEDAPSIIKSTK